jgi:excisionase family DNA binding protein
MRAVSDPVHLLTIPQVAERLALSRRSVEKLIHDGELRTVRFGRSVRVTEAAVAQLVAARERRRVA